MSASSWARVSAAMGIPFVVGFVVLGVLSGNSPDHKSSDSKILDWYASHGHRVSDIAGIFVLAVSRAGRDSDFVVALAQVADG